MITTRDSPKLSRRQMLVVLAGGISTMATMPVLAKLPIGKANAVREEDERRASQQDAAKRPFVLSI